MKVGELVQYLKVDREPHRRGLREAKRDAEREGAAAGKGWSDNWKKAVRVGLRGFLYGILAPFGAAMAVGAVTVATKFATTFLAKTIGILGPGLAAVALLVPATIGSAVLAVGALKLALGGVGDALKAGLVKGDVEKFNELLKKLSPSAQAVVRDLVGLKAAFDFLKRSVQESFFAPLVDQIRKLATTYLPILRIHLMDVAATFGAATRELMLWLRTPDMVRLLDGALDAMAAAVSNIAEGLPGIVRGLLTLVGVGATFLPGLTGGFAELTNRFAAWMQEIAASGQLQDFISNGLSGFGDLLRIVRELGVIMHTVLGAAIDAGLLDAFRTLGGLVKQLVAGAGPGLQRFLSALVVGLVAIAQAAGPVGQALSDVLIAVAPLLPALGNLGAVILVQAANILKILAAEAGPFILWLSTLATNVLPMLLPLLATLVQSALPLTIDLFHGLTEALWPLIPVITEFAKQLISQLMPVLPRLAVAFGEIIPPVLQLAHELVPLLVLVLQGLIPVIPVVVVLVAALIGILRIVARIAGDVIEVFARLISIVRQSAEGWGGFIKSIAGVPGQIQAIFSSAGTWLFDAGRRIIDGLIEGIKSKAGLLKDVLDWVSSKIPDWKGPLDRDQRLLVPAGVAIIGGLMGGIRSQLPGLRSLLGDVTSMAGGVGTAAGRPRGPLAGDGGDGAALLAETRRTNELLSRLRLTADSRGLALSVRAGERDLRYT